MTGLSNHSPEKTRCVLSAPVRGLWGTSLAAVPFTAGSSASCRPIPSGVGPRGAADPWLLSRSPYHMLYVPCTHTLLPPVVTHTYHFVLTCVKSYAVVKLLSPYLLVSSHEEIVRPHVAVAESQYRLPSPRVVNVQLELVHGHILKPPQLLVRLRHL